MLTKLLASDTLSADRWGIAVIRNNGEIEVLRDTYPDEATARAAAAKVEAGA